MSINSIAMISFMLTGIAIVEAHWWSMGMELPFEDVVYRRFSACETEGLSTNQKELCLRYHSHMAYVSVGAQIGIRECQHQFKGNRWNCSTVKDSSVFGKIIKTATKETAFTYAVTSAGVLYSVAKACLTNELTECGCNRKSRPEGLNRDWAWSGCGDDTDYAYGFTSEFIDAHERDQLSPRGKKNKARKHMNLLNNEAGRMAVLKANRPRCKCHGVSGSCSMKSCWMQIQNFREIGENLLMRYHDSVEMKLSKKGYLRPRKFPKSELERTDLVYLESSPNYCNKNRRMGIRGTRGRECDINSNGSDGCELLCCGRGYRSREIEVEEQCNCDFVWCCDVQCEICKRKVRHHYCR